MSGCSPRRAGRSRIPTCSSSAHLDIIGTLGLGVLLAILLDRSVRFEGIFRTILLYPLSISFIVTGLTWQWVLSPTIGVQQFVRGLGWDRLRVRLDHPAGPSDLHAGVRRHLAPVRPDHGHHAGRAARRRPGDLARRARRGHSRPGATYVSIVLPMLRPLMVTCVVLIAIAVVKSYDLVVAMTNGGPGFSSDLPGKFVVDFEFERANIGQASAAATVMLGSVLAIVAPYLYFELARKNR